MNKTQEEITTGYTIGHAVSTIERLIEESDFVMQRAVKVGNVTKIAKLSVLVAALGVTLAAVKKCKELIDTIDG